MPVRIVIYARQGEGSATAVVSQVRALVNEMRVDATLQLVTDETMHAANGVERTPAISIDGLMIANGWVPSRQEMRRAIEGRIHGPTQQF